MPGFPHRRRALGLILPADVPARLKPWTDDGASQYQGQTPAPDNAQLLRNKAARFESLFKSIGGKAAVAPDAIGYDSTRAPWIEAPDGYQPFMFQGIIATPAANNTDTLVMSLFNGQPVPQGWDGVITQIANFYTGAGFVAGSGQLTWRITQNGQPFKTFDSIQVGWGTFTQQGGVAPFTLPVPLRIFSGDVIKYIVNVSNVNPLPIAGTSIIVYLGGYIYPKRGQ